MSVQGTLGRVPELRCLLPMLRQSAPALGRSLSSGQENGHLPVQDTLGGPGTEMSAANAQAKRFCARQIPILRILKIAWLVLWVSGGSQPTLRPSYPGAARTERGLCPYSDRVFCFPN